MHVEECGACPLMPRRYEDQRKSKRARLEKALERYDLVPSRRFRPIAEATSITGYRRRAKLVVAREPSGEIAVGLYRRHDNQNVVDIPHCQVLSPMLVETVGELREIANAPPPELAPLMTPAVAGEGVLTGIDLRQLKIPDSAAGEEEGEGSSEGSVLLTLLLAAERAAPVDDLREAARALRARLPQLSGVSVSLRYSSRTQASSEFHTLSGLSEAKDALGEGYQFVSHTSFLHVHRGQADQLYDVLVEVIQGGLEGAAEDQRRVLDLYGGTGA
ncbi:MAG: hypothetical protein KC731_33980, partial [Myxococcales bacterium]|nr:hypothetical protein [Myxococcales bacterium]